VVLWPGSGRQHGPLKCWYLITTLHGATTQKTTNCIFTAIKISNLTSVWCISYSEWSETRRCFITISLQLCFIICHQTGPRKSGRTENEWNTLAPGQCWQC
jgi:hypothetical protein